MAYNLEPYSFDEIEESLNEYPNKIGIVICTFQFFKGINDVSDKLEIEDLACIAEIRKYGDCEYAYAIRPNRNVFRDHEFDRYEEHQWRVEPKSNLSLYNPFKLDINHLLLMSLGYTINIDTGEIHEPEYTWSYKKY